MTKIISDLNGICPRLDSFLRHNKRLCNCSVLQRFLIDKENKQLFIHAICQPNETNEEALDKAFRYHFGNMKLTSYILKTLHWHAIQYDQHIRKSNKRFPLILDQSFFDENEPSYLLDVISREEALEESFEENGERLEDMIGKDDLFMAYQRLTDYQKDILEKSYVKGWKDTEIAEHLHISQQAVFKTRKTSLDKMRAFMKRRNTS
ncbi:hypothetical protein ACE1TI_06820 [Alteribacillus sp. JSM 102045]|uniref:hypothetical protein n=1 Tax=Alteribacillus sp. JSM 102045 TaxID=1562101 RepID=UPI0035BFDBAB